MKVLKRQLRRANLPVTLLPAALLGSLVVLVDLWNLVPILRVVRASVDSGDSWNAMRAAWDWFAAQHQGSLYQQVFFAHHIKFQYPPSSLLLFEVAAIFHVELTNRVLNCFNYALFSLQAAVTGYVAYVAIQKLASPERKIWSWAIGLITALLTLDFGPALVATALGQVQTWINTLFVLAWLCWLRDRRILAGVCIGVICIFKPQFVLFVLWGLLRKERRFLVGWVAVMVPATILSLAFFGLANHFDYLAALRFMGQRGEVYYANQSVNGLLNRFLGNGNSAVFQSDEFPPFHPLVYGGTLVSSLALIAVALFYRVRASRTNLIDFSIAGLTFTLASPIAWNHHYGILPILLLLAAITISAIASPQKRGWYACALVVLWALEGHWTPPPNSPHTGFASLLWSTVFLAGLGVLWMLYRCRDPYAERIAPRLEANRTHPALFQQADPLYDRV